MSYSRIHSRTQSGVVGAGPAGLMLSHLLARAGIDTVTIDVRSRRETEETRVHRDGYRHDGIELAFGGGGHRIDFQGLVGASTQLYPQTDVFIDLADARERDGGDVRFGVTDVSVDDLVSDSAVMRFTDVGGAVHEVRAEILVGADGSRSLCRSQVPEAGRTQSFREYPLAWFGILTEAPPSAPELIYNHSPHGFALISQRTETLRQAAAEPVNLKPRQSTLTDWSASPAQRGGISARGRDSTGPVPARDRRPGNHSMVPAVSGVRRAGTGSSARSTTR
jgi:2-polyprenyl-6-methoxyphenol hydroxylase-like FAD-dependent oxidoreductase